MRFACFVVTSALGARPRDPCPDLCEHDGRHICTGGSWTAGIPVGKHCVRILILKSIAIEPSEKFLIAGSYSIVVTLLAHATTRGFFTSVLCFG